MRSVAGNAAAAADMSPACVTLCLLPAAAVLADRYYGLVASGAPAGAPSAEQRALAFKAVAAAWYEVKEETAGVAGAMLAAEVVYVSLVWRFTGDLTAAAVAVLAAGATDYWHKWRRVAGRAPRRRQPGGQ